MLNQLGLVVTTIFLARRRLFCIDAERYELTNEARKATLAWLIFFRFPSSVP